MIVAVPGRNQTVIPYIFHSVTAFKDLYALHRLIRYPCINTAHLSPAPNRSSVLQCFERDNACNRFLPGTAAIWLTYISLTPLHLLMNDKDVFSPSCVVKDYERCSTPSTFWQALVQSTGHNQCSQVYSESVYCRIKQSTHISVACFQTMLPAFHCNMYTLTLQRACVNSSEDAG